MTDAGSFSGEQLDLLRRRILNVTGHALRTPVTTVRGLAAALAEGGVDQAPDPEVVAALHHQAARLEALVDDVLLATGVTTAVPVEQPATVDLVPALARRWPADVDRPETEGRADAVVVAEALDRVAVHVAANTARYLAAPYRVVGASADGRASVAVSGVGEGPTDDELDLAFEPLFRGEHAVMRTSGLGLGLAVCATLLAAMGGSIELTRTADGLVTTIELPAP